MSLIKPIYTFFDTSDGWCVGDRVKCTRRESRYYDVGAEFTLTLSPSGALVIGEFTGHSGEFIRVYQDRKEPKGKGFARWVRDV